MNCINYNGEIFGIVEPVLRITNRAFNYGDAIFETMRWHKRKVFFLNDHMERLLKGMQLLKMEIPITFTVENFQKQFLELVSKCGILKDARIRLQVFRNEGEYYSPTNNSVSFVIRAEPVDGNSYGLDVNGCAMGIFTDFKKSISLFSNFKTGNCIVNVMAGISSKENMLDDSFILNADNKITDSISSNLFIVKENIIFTPPLSDGCVDGVLRKNLLNFLIAEKIPVVEKSISEKDLIVADEIFLTNAIHGISWVKGFKEKKFLNDFSKMIAEKFYTTLS